MLKKIGILFSGSILAQLIPLLSIPILTRLFSPEEMGIYSLYLVIVSLGVIFSTLRLEIAIPLVAKKEIKSFIANTILLNFFGSIVVTLIIAGIEYRIDIFSTYQTFVIGVMLFLSINIVGIYQVMYQSGIRNSQFKILATNKVLNQILIAIFLIIVGLLFNNYLLYALIIAQIINFYILKKQLNLDFDLQKVSRNSLKNTVLEYNKFPLFQLPIQLFNTLSQNLILLSSSVLFTASEVGHYALTERILRSPISLIGSSSADIFKNMAAKEIKEKGNCLTSYKKIIFFNFLTGIPIFLLIYFIINTAVYYLLGENWMEVAQYAKILLPSLFAIYIVFPVNYLFVIYDSQKLELLIQLVQFVTVLFVIVYTSKIKLELEGLLIAYTYISTFFSVLVGVVGILLIKYKKEVFL